MGNVVTARSELNEGNCRLNTSGPKELFANSLGATDEHPGYYWLAYSWHNLFFGLCRLQREKEYFIPSERSREACSFSPR